MYIYKNLLIFISLVLLGKNLVALSLMSFYFMIDVYLILYICSYIIL